MDQRITQFLGQSYRRSVFGQQVNVELPNDSEFKEALKEELARIRRIGSPDLAARDFAAYQSQKAIESALAQLEQQDAS